MAVNKITYLTVRLLILTNLYVIAYDSVNDTIRCQFGRSVRKQVPAEPLNGMCLQDVAGHVSQTLRCISNEELGVSSFQRIIDNVEFARMSSSLAAKLSLLVNKYSNKLMMYIDILNQSYNAIHPVLSKTQDHSVYSSQTIDLNIIQDRVPDMCTRVITGIYCY